MSTDDGFGQDATPTPDELRQLTGYDAPAETHTELVRRAFDEAQYRAAETVIAMATGQVERDPTRLKAAIFVIEFIHGPNSKAEGKMDPWDDALRRMEAGGKRTDDHGGS